MRELAFLDISRLGPDDLAALDTDDGDAMHVRLTHDGPWHRRAANKLQTVTACGKTLPSVPAMGWYHTTLRRAEYEGPLCSVCFTEWEIGESERNAGLERLRSIPDSSNGNPGGDDGP